MTSREHNRESSQRILRALKEARARLEAIDQTRSEPIAIVGVGCRFPGGVIDGPSYWRLLRNGVDAVSEIPADRFDVDAYYDPEPGKPGKIYTRQGGFLDEIGQFDPQFFGISPREAISLDPQQRLLLEVSWEALENAGQAPDKLQGSRTGVFVGIGQNDYGQLQLTCGDPSVINAYFGTGNGLCFAPGRLSHVLGLRGPNMAIDTACSSSLVAVHLALQSLRAGECDLALAGGSHLSLSPNVAVFLSMAKALSADGRCKAFDAAADGFGRGEGCGVVVLKRLSDAVAQCDNILALIRGSAINHDGLSSGLTVPNEAAQRELLELALANARVAPKNVSYVEAHGTGTSLGDPIEVSALAAVLAQGRSHDRPLVIGSVKTNFGHLEAAAGIAGLIKVALSLDRQELPPQLHFKTPNPNIPWDELPIVVATRPKSWRRGDSPRVAGVSSFGMSGANAHVVLEEAPALPLRQAKSQRPLHIIRLSARSEPALRRLAGRYRECLTGDADLDLGDVGFTTNTGRARLPFRASVVAESRVQAVQSFEALAGGQLAIGEVDESATDELPIAFLFTGQGSQYANMGRRLYQTQPAFRQQLDRCDEILRPCQDRSLLEVLFSNGERENLLDQTEYTQPALFALEYALARLWQIWGIRPQAVCGHSLGEYVAACIAGVFSVEDGLKLVSQRARQMQSISPAGEMVAVLAEEARVRAAIERHEDAIAIAAVNGPRNVVISGTTAGIRAVVARLETAGIRTLRLPVSHAFHSPVIEPVLDEFQNVASQVSYSVPGVPLASNLTGRMATPDIATAEYWTRHARQTVRFADAIQTLYQRGYRVFLEIGPAPTLTVMSAHCLANDAVLLPSLRKGRDDWRELLETLGRLDQLGASIDWEAFDRDYPRRRIPLPTYPFERQRYWFETGVDQHAAPSTVTRNWTYQLSWHEQRPRETSTDQQHDPGQWLIFDNNSGLGRRLGQLIEARGDRCVYVRAADEFAKTSTTSWDINPASAVDFASLLQELPGELPLKGSVYLWTCESKPPGELTVDELQRAQVVGCGGVTRLVRTLAEHEASGVRLWFVTRHWASSGELDERSPALTHSPVWGLGKVIALEHPELWGGMIDLDAKPEEDDAARVVTELYGAGCEDQILLREGTRFVGRLEQVAAPPKSAATTLRTDATYLITGGLGALGLRVARWMVEQGARHLVLVGRREPSPIAWNVVEQLRHLGASVAVASADVAEVEDMRRVLAEVAASLPPLGGIVHAAGVFGYEAIRNLDEETLQSVLRPKVIGAWVLHQLTSGRELDLFVCFSSVASAWGSKGQGHYAAANQFLDALAHYRHSQGLPALSINWGPWDGGGMTSAEARVLLERMGVKAMSPQAALAVLSRHLGSSSAQLVVANVDWVRFRALYEAKRRRPLFECLLPPATPGATPQATPPSEILRQLTQLPLGQRREQLVSYLLKEVSGILGLSDAQPPDPRKGFFKMGMDSLMAVELTSRLVAGLRVSLAPTVVFYYSNIRDLAEYLATSVLGWESPVSPQQEPPVAQDEQEITSYRSGAVSDDELPTSIAARLSKLESLIRDA